MDQVYQLIQESINKLKKVTDSNSLEKWRINILGRQGQLNQLALKIAALTGDEKKQFGIKINKAKKDLTAAYQKKQKQLIQEHQKTVPLDQPGQPINSFGHLHIVTQAIEEITRIFSRIGFERQRYPEIDWDWYAFEALNMPKNHPARDEWETLFVDTPPHPKLGKMVLTPHTSNGQVREMERKKSRPPIRMINIARNYRRQQDITHTVMLHQFEGLWVDKNINIGHLKGVIDFFAVNYYGPTIKSRIRPFNFKFTEPSFEVDFTCSVCEGKGCRSCKSGWHEVGGAGMVHPNVLKAGGIDPDKYSGFAFGWGVERSYMMKPGLKIPDLRLFYQNDIRFLEQF